MMDELLVEYYQFFLNIHCLIIGLLYTKACSMAGNIEHIFYKNANK